MGKGKKPFDGAAAGEELAKVEQAVKVGAGKPFKLADRVDVPATARRFGLTAEDVRDAITQAETGSSVTVTVRRRREELQQYLQDLYDREARRWSFESMAEMMATAHAKIVGHAIVNPERFAPAAIATLRDVAKLLYAPDKLSVTRRLPPGESREALLARLANRLREAPPEPIDVQALDIGDSPTVLGETAACCAEPSPADTAVGGTLVPSSPLRPKPTSG